METQQSGIPLWHSPVWLANVDEILEESSVDLIWAEKLHCDL
jgi:hypothetical protein